MAAALLARAMKRRKEMKTDYRAVLRRRANTAREPYEHKALDHIGLRNKRALDAWLTRLAEYRSRNDEVS